MLHAILHGKAAKVSVQGVDTRWRDLFREREDLLTAAFFGRLAYLSSPVRRLVMGVLLDSELAEDIGDLESVEFWPRFDLEDGGNFVEPDVLLQFSRLFVVVEVKPPKGGAQDVAQWRRELNAVRVEYGSARRSSEAPRLHLLALGNNAPHWQQLAATLLLEFTGASISISAQEWQPLARGLMHLLDECSGGDRAVVEDWLRALGLFNISTGFPDFRMLLPLGASNFDEWQALLEPSKWATPAITTAWPDWRQLLQFSTRNPL